MPVGGSGEGVTAYREVTLASEIVRELKVAKFLESSDRDDLRAAWLNEAELEAAGFEVFACFRTNRAKYRCVLLILGANLPCCTEHSISILPVEHDETPFSCFQERPACRDSMLPAKLTWCKHLQTRVA